MNNKAQITISPILKRFVEKCLADEQYRVIFSSLCEDVHELGVPLRRAHLSMQTLHPLVASVDLTWRRETGLEVRSRAYEDVQKDNWLESPFFWMLSNNVFELRQDLSQNSGWSLFPIYDELRELGGTDYFAAIIPFGDPHTAIKRQDGILTSWLCDAPEGFTDHNIDTINALLPFIGLASKLSKHDYTTRNILSAYLGEKAGQKVLDGQIRLGDVTHIPAVIWYSDMRGSTALAEKVSVKLFLKTVNDYFNCTAGTILEQGGEVLRFIGDAVMAIFPVTDDQSPTMAAELALRAAHQAQDRLGALNQQRRLDGLDPVEFGLGLHYGELLYGNIGVPERIEFSLIGRAANEVARLESLTKQANENVLVSHEFKQLIDLHWRGIGEFSVKGVGETMRVYAPPGQGTL